MENNLKNEYVENLADSEVPVSIETGATGLNADLHNAVAVNSPFSEIDLNEFETESDHEIFDTVSSAIQGGALKPQNMLPIEIMEDGVTGLYARRVKHYDGKSEVALVYYHNGGSCSGDITIPNTDLLTVILYENGKATPSTAKEAEKAFKRIQNKVLEYWDGSTVFDMHVILSTLSTVISKLPEDTYEVPDIKIVYATIVDYVNKQGEFGAIYCRKGVYAFPKDTFTDIAKKVNMSATQLAMYLKSNGLLYLQDSSIGYQCKVRAFHEYCYCVLTMKEYQNEVEPYDASDFWNSHMSK